MYQRFDVNGRNGRVSFRRTILPGSPTVPRFLIYRKKRGDSGFSFTNTALNHELEEFMGNLMRAQEYFFFEPRLRPATNLTFDDLVEIWNNVVKAAALLGNCYQVVPLFRDVLTKLGHGYVAGTAKLP